MEHSPVICICLGKLSLSFWRPRWLKNNAANRKGRYMILYSFFCLHTAHIQKISITLYTINFYTEKLNDFCIPALNWFDFSFANTNHILSNMLYTNCLTSFEMFILGPFDVKRHIHGQEWIWVITSLCLYKNCKYSYILCIIECLQQYANLLG